MDKPRIRHIAIDVITTSVATRLIVSAAKS